MSRMTVVTTGSIVRPPIIAMAPNDWMTAWVGRQQLLTRLAARGWPVVYSSGPLSLWDRGGGRWRRAGLLSSFQRHDGVWVETPGRSSVYWPRSRIWAAAARRALAARLVRQARKLGTGPPVLMLFHPRFVDYVDLLPHQALAYHAYDAFSEVPGWTAALATREARLTGLADRVFAVSSEVGRKLAGPGPGRFIELPNGADAAAFAAGAQAPCPPDLVSVPAPRIGYVGRISLKLDLALLGQLATARPTLNWVFIGPVSFGREGGTDLAAFEALRKLPNVHFLGEKSHRDLPAYQAHMAVNILCYKSTPGWWISCSPLKIHEYLATGVPVVASALASLRELGDVIAMPTADREAWLSALDAAVDGRGVGTRESRQAMAAANSWDSRVDRLEAELASLVSARTTGAATS